ncbi:unnamed protein product [Choristocarpus tenellus]
MKPGLPPFSKNEDMRDSSRELSDSLFSKIPPSVWQPRVIVKEDRPIANYLWSILVSFYVAYILLLVKNAFERRENPTVMYNLVSEPFELPDIGFCFDQGEYTSKMGCYTGTTPKECAESFRGDTFVYGYNTTKYTTPEGYAFSPEHVVVLPERLSDKCAQFSLSDLTVNGDTTEWKFHSLIFWNSSVAKSEEGIFQNVKMYLYEKSLALESRLQGPVILYVPISFDADNVPFVRGFLEMQQRKHLDGSVEREYSVVGVTTTTWSNSLDATSGTSAFGTDTIASVQFDVRVQQYVSIEDVDPIDILAILGEIGGFWVGVPVLFGICFYRSQEPEVDIKMRTYFRCECPKGQKVPYIFGTQRGHKSSRSQGVPVVNVVSDGDGEQDVV